MSEPQVTCTDITPLLDAFHDGELEAHERSAVERHLESCAHCQGKLGEIDTLVSSLRGLPQIKPGRDFAEDFPQLLADKQKNVVALRPLTWASMAVAAAAVLLFLAVKTFHSPGAPAVVADGGQKGKSGQALPDAKKVPAAKDDLAQKPDSDNLYRNEEMIHSEGTARNGSKDNSAASKVVRESKRQEIAVRTAPPAGKLKETAGDDSSTAGRQSNFIAQKPAGINANLAARSAAQDNDEASAAGNVEVATLDEVGHSSVTGALGLATDEDGLYAINL